MNNIIDKRCKPVYCIEDGRRWNSATECAKELYVTVNSVYNACNGIQRTCIGLHLTYEENYTELKNMMSQRIASISEKLPELERKAALWDAFQLEQEKKRKAEEARNAAIAKAEAKLERRKRLVECCDATYQKAIHAMMEAEKELAELKGDKNK